MKERYLAVLVRGMIFLSGILLTGCGSQEDTESYSDIFAETEQMPDLTESVDTSQMIAYEYLGGRYYQGEKVQIWGERQIEGCSIYLHREDGSRELLAEHISPFEMDKGWWIDDQKRCYYMNGTSLVQVKENGEKVFSIEPEAEELFMNICQLADGRIIVAVNKTFETKLCELDPASGKLSTLAGLPVYTSLSLMAPNGDGLMMINDKGLWDVNLTDGTLSSIISFEGTSYALKNDNPGFEGYLVKEDIRLLEDGSAELLWSDGTSEFLRPAQAGEGKEIMVMRFMFPDSMMESWMKERIVEFNQKSENYYIKIDEATDDSDWNEFRERTDMDLAVEKGADIVCCYAVNDAGSLIEKGAFEDLTPYMEASGIREEDYFPAAFSGWKEDGKIYGFNYTVYMKGFWVDKAIAGDAGIDSVEELVDCLLNYEGDAVIPSSAAYILRSFLENSESLCGMVDFENGTCDFSGELFGKMLEAAKKYQWEESKDDYIRATGISHYWNFFSFSDIEYWDKLGKVPVGYLFDDGGHIKAYTDAMLAINANSANKEGAWEFFCYLLSEEAQGSFAVSMTDKSDSEWRNYPVDRKIFEELCEKHKTYNNGYDVTVNSGRTEFKDVLMTGLTEERKAELVTALEDARPAPLKTQPLVKIVVEEARSYFSGDKTIDEVRSLIQNRVQLYLNEKK